MKWTLSAFADEAASPIDGQIAALRRAGLRHVDLRAVDGVNISELPIEQAREARQRLDRAGVVVTMFGSPIGKIDIQDDAGIDLGKLEHLGKLADVFDCRWVRVFSYYNRTGQSSGRWRDESLLRLRRLRQTAAGLKLVLFLENEADIYGDRAAQVLELAQDLRDEGSFRLIFDFDNFHQSAEDTWDTWLMLRDFIDAFHLKDSDAQRRHVPMGQGATQATRILSDARSRGWTGPLAVEPHLKNSAAVTATGGHGGESEQFADMSDGQCFQVAVEAARRVLDQVGAKVD